MRSFDLPSIGIRQGEEITSRTYKVSDGKIEGFVDDLEAIKQAVYKRLNTEQFEFPIYSFDYGLQWNKLLGKDQVYVRAELPRMISETLLRDDRIIAVNNFSFSFDAADECRCSFSVETVYGQAQMGVTTKNV